MDYETTKKKHLDRVKKSLKQIEERILILEDEIKNQTSLLWVYHNHATTELNKYREMLENE